MSLNERQMSSAKRRGIGEIETYLDSFGRIRKSDEGKSYYLKIDHLQVLPTETPFEYLIVTVYHTVYLK